MNRIDLIQSKLKSVKCAALAVIAFSFIAHGYRFANNMYSHDALLMIYQNDYAWQVALGRFIQPLLILVRGSLCNPWLICFIAIFFQILSVIFTTDFMGIESKTGIVLTAGIFVCNPIVISANSAYLPWVDFYAFSCFLAVFSVWCMKKEVSSNKQKILYRVVGVCALTGSLGIYQAYLCMALGLVMLEMFSLLISKVEFSGLIKKVVRYLAYFTLSVLLYYVMWKLAQKVFHVWTANTYNGLSEVSDYSDIAILALIRKTYYRVFYFFWNPEIFKSIIFRNISMGFLWKWALRVVNMITAGIIFVRLFQKNKKQKTEIWQWILQIVLLFILPFGINFVCFVSKGMEHTLMIFAFLLVYVLAIWLMEEHLLQSEQKLHLSKGTVILATSFLVLIWSNVVYANQVYLKKELQAEAAQSLMTRIVADIEHTEGYVPGQTKVAIYGSFEISDNISKLTDFEEVEPYGMGKTAITYHGADYSFLTYIINANMELTSLDTEDETIREYMKSIPSYPEEGSITYMGDILIVKVSDL